MKRESIESPPILIIELQSESNVRLRYQQMDVYNIRLSFRQALQELKRNIPHSGIVISDGDTGTSIATKGRILTREFFHLAHGTPLLAINRAMNEMAQTLGGKVEEQSWRGTMPVQFYLDMSILFLGFPEVVEEVWFDHRDTIPYSYPSVSWKIPRSKRLGRHPLFSKGFRKVATTLPDEGQATFEPLDESEEILRPRRQIAALIEKDLQWHGVAFSPEVEENFAPVGKFPIGKMLLANFARLCGHRIHGLTLEEERDEADDFFERRADVRVPAEDQRS